MCVFKNTDQNNIWVSIVLKAKTEEEKMADPPKKGIFKFCNKNRKKLSSHFSKTHKKTLLTVKNGQNGVFDSQ